MNNLLEYKGYQGTVEYSAGDNILHGKVVGIRGLISYEGESLASLQSDFREAIDHYLSCCEEEGLQPVTPYCGNLSDIQISPAVHKSIYSYAERTNKPPSLMVEEALESYIASR